MNSVDALKMRSLSVSDPEGGLIWPWPPLSKLAMKFDPPLGGRKNNESSVNFPKFKVFDPPMDFGHGFWSSAGTSYK